MIPRHLRVPMFFVMESCMLGIVAGSMVAWTFYEYARRVVKK